MSPSEGIFFQQQAIIWMQMCSESQYVPSEEIQKKYR